MTGNYGWWPGLWLYQLVRLLPDGRYLAAHAPGAISLVAIAALAWQARRLWGTLSGLVAAVVALSAGASAWTYQFAYSGRATTWWAMIALALATAQVVEQSASRQARKRVVARSDAHAGSAPARPAHAGGAPARPGHARAARSGSAPARLGGARAARSLTPLPPGWLVWPGALAAALAGAIVLSGDDLAWTVTVVPLAGAVALLCCRRAWAPAAGVATLAAVVAGGSFAFRAIANGDGYIHRVSPVGHVPFDRYGDGAGRTVTALTRVWLGPGGGVIDHLAGYAGAALALIALVGGAAWVWRGAVSPREPSAALPRDAWMAFWLLALVAMLAAFVTSDAAFVDGAIIPRYLYGVPFAAAGLLAGLCERTSVRRPVAALAIGCGALAAVAMLAAAPPRRAKGRVAIAAAVARVAEQHGLTRGYAGYWSAYPIEVASGWKLDMVPVGGCPAIADRYALCPMYLHYIDRSYLPRDRGSFLLIDPHAAPPGPRLDALTQLPTGLRPKQVVDVGDGVRMAIFDRDVAAALNPIVGSDVPPVGKGAPLVADG
jgi:hypothetical protein